jgi:hypothetical protein
MVHFSWQQPGPITLTSDKDAALQVRACPQRDRAETITIRSLPERHVLLLNPRGDCIARALRRLAVPNKAGML